MIKKISGLHFSRRIYLILALGLLGLGLSWVFTLYSGKKTEAGHGGMSPGFAMPVEACKIRVETIHEEAVTVGTITANESVMIRPEIGGRVAGIYFQEGQKVARGDLLVKLDDSVYAANVAESEANLAFSESKNQRQVSLYKQNYTSGDKKDEAVAKFRVDEAILNRRKAELEKTKILAPFDGFVGLRKISPGDYVQAGQDIVMLMNLDPIKVEFSLPEIYFLHLEVGQKIELTSDALPGKKFEGDIFAVHPAINENGRNLEMKGKLSNVLKDVHDSENQGNHGFLLMPGMFVRVRVILQTRKNALVIPEEAIVLQGDDHFVYTVKDGKAKLTQVRIGIRSQGKVEIREGLSRDEEVITAGQIKIGDGMPVKIVPEKKSASS